VFRALGGSGQEARIVHVQQRLADMPAFTTALYRFGREMSALDHPRVVAIRHVGNSGTDVAVLTDSVAGPVALDDIQARGEASIPRDIAMALALGAIEGLSHAHSLGVVHGAVHPQSVLVDFHGGVKLADFGLAWALAAAAVAGKNPSLYAGLRGFVAPEMALGQTPSARSDVYAAGALLHCLWTGQPPSGSAGDTDAPPALLRLLERTLAVDPLARPVNGTEVEEMLEEAITSGGIRVAPPDEVAAFVSRLLAEPRARRDSTEGLSAATSDLIAELEAPQPARRAVSDVIAGLEAEADARGGTRRFKPGIQVTPAPVLKSRTPRPVPERSVGFDSDSVTAFDSEPTQGEVSQVTQLGEHTEVDSQSMLLGAEPDPISAILKLSDSGRVVTPSPLEDPTPLPEPSTDHPGTVTRHIQELELEQEEERARGRKKQKFGRSDAVDSLAETLPIGARAKEQLMPALPEPGAGGTFPGPAPPPPRRPSTKTGATQRPASELSGIPGPYENWGRPRRKRVLLALALTVFALSALGAFLYTQTDLFDPGRRAAEERAAERADEDALAKHAAEQVQPVDLTVTSAEPDAAVWLLLGRTPFESMSLSSGMVHELRFEHEGYLPLDLRVTGYEWKGEDKQARRAEVNASLVAGEPKGPVPAVGPEPASPPPPGPAGRGVLAVKSTPAGAQVWLLIGFTPRATITGLPAGRDVEVKVLKNGFLPGFAAIKGDEWYLSGRSGPVQPSMLRDVALTRAKPAAPVKKSKGASRSGARREGERGP
jgi:serine/threonine protein kinase